MALSSQVKKTTDQNAHQIRMRPYHQAFLQLRICCFVSNKHLPHGHCDLQRVENTVSFLVSDHSRCTKIKSFKAQGGRLRVNTQDMQNWRTTHFKTWLSSTDHFYMKYGQVSRRRTSLWRAARNVPLRVFFSSYGESNEGSKERQGPPVSVLFIEASFKTESPAVNFFMNLSMYC